MLTGTFTEFFAAIAGSAAALTGLLFVAMSVAPRTATEERPVVIQQVRAAAAIVAFTNALGVSLFGLVPGNNVGYPAIVAGLAGALFIAAGVRSMIADEKAQRHHVRRQLRLIVALFIIFGFELYAGIALLVDPHHTGAAELLGNLLVALLLVGFARAWELIGDRDTGIRASLSVLTGHEPGAGGRSDGQPGAS